MESYKIIRLKPEDYDKCSNIWDMKKHPDKTKKWYDELVSGNRIIFVYTENDEFLGEGALVLDAHDQDYTIPNKRICVSRFVVKPEHRGRGIGGIILDYLADQAKLLGYDEVSVGVNTNNLNARHLYEKKGFSNVIYEGEDEYGECVKLLKKL